MAEAFTLYKLIILYMLDKVDFPLTNSQISEFVLDKGYTDYFKLQQALSELADGGLILKESTHNRTLFHLTEGRFIFSGIKSQSQSRMILTTFYRQNSMI